MLCFNFKHERRRMAKLMNSLNALCVLRAFCQQSHFMSAIITIPHPRRSSCANAIENGTRFFIRRSDKYINSIQINWPSDVTQKWRAKELNVIFFSFRMKSGYSWARRHTKSSHQMSEYSQFGERKSCKCALVTSWHSWIKIQNLIFYFSYFKIFNLVAFIAEIWSWMN